MIGLGTIVNACAIAAGSTVGLVLGRGIKEKYRETVIKGLAVCVMMLGLQMSLKGEHILLTIASIVIGSLIGEALNIEKRLNDFGLWLGSHFSRGKEEGTSRFAQGFLNTSLLYCVGAMAIVGSIQDGISGDTRILYTKAMIDGLSGIIYAANMGVGVMFSAISVAVYQGILTILAGLLAPVVTEAVVQEISVSGGLMIFAIGINMLELTSIRVGNMVPGLFVAGLMAYFMY
jgi:uncharacterized membrane protein YqgA involved in biofilm formation